MIEATPSILAAIVRDAWAGQMPDGTRILDDPDQLHWGRLIVVDAKRERYTWVTFEDLAQGGSLRGVIRAADDRFREALASRA